MQWRRMDITNDAKWNEMKSQKHTIALGHKEQSENTKVFIPEIKQQKEARNAHMK